MVAASPCGAPELYVLILGLREIWNLSTEDKREGARAQRPLMIQALHDLTAPFARNLGIMVV